MWEARPAILLWQRTLQVAAGTGSSHIHQTIFSRALREGEVEAVIGFGIIFHSLPGTEQVGSPVNGQTADVEHGHTEHQVSHLL
jgi:hypothetical protein